MNTQKEIFFAPLVDYSPYGSELLSDTGVEQVIELFTTLDSFLQSKTVCILAGQEKPVLEMATSLQSPLQIQKLEQCDGLNPRNCEVDDFIEHVEIIDDGFNAMIVIAKKTVLEGFAESLKIPELQDVKAGQAVYAQFVGNWDDFGVSRVVAAKILRLNNA